MWIKTKECGKYKKNSKERWLSMGFLELVFMGIGLSMDAFAVSICKGLKMKKLNVMQAFVIGCFFGGFQALMPLLGWLIGTQFASYITSIDHWIAFLLLAFIGGNMVREALSKEEENVDSGMMDPPLDVKEMLLLAIATSIDALAIGVTFAFLSVDIIPAIGIIGCITFVISIAGVAIGNYFGNKYEKKAALAGGIILIMIGVKILIEHLFA